MRSMHALASVLRAVADELDRPAPSVPLPAAILSALADHPSSGSGLAQRLQRRRSTVLDACRALAAERMISRSGSEWIVAVGPTARLTAASSAVDGVGEKRVHP